METESVVWEKDFLSLCFFFFLFLKIQINGKHKTLQAKPTSCAFINTDQFKMSTRIKKGGEMIIGTLGYSILQFLPKQQKKG
jgi:hypothetical protein